GSSLLMKRCAPGAGNADCGCGEPCEDNADCGTDLFCQASICCNDFDCNC
ncbi:18687_t:CDS:1, partial [Racocetra fulgida]